MKDKNIKKSKESSHIKEDISNKSSSNEESISHDKHKQQDHNNHEGHNHHHGNFKKILMRSFPIALIIMLLSPIMGYEFPFTITFIYSDIVVSFLATILLIYGAKPFYMGAIEEFKEKSPSMMALVTMGLLVSYIYSIYAVISRYITGKEVMDYFFEFTSLLLIMLLGHWIEMKAIGEAGNAQKSLAELIPKNANLILDDGSIESHPVIDLKVGDLIRVKGGENIPVDGIVREGNSRVNESLLTGESKPVYKNSGDKVIGGSTNKEGSLDIEVEEIGEKSFMSQVQELIKEAQNQPSRAENLANKVASALFYVAITAALISFIVWLYFTNLERAIIYTVTTLVIACPHALGLAIPLVIARSTSLGAQKGLLVKDREALELTTKADFIILDKTGTLTSGNFKVLNVKALNKDYSKNEIIALMAGIEGGSSHPIASSIIDYAKSKEIDPVEFNNIEILTGKGIQGQANNKSYKLISEKELDKKVDLDVPKGSTTSIMVEGDEIIGLVSLGDELKSSSKDLIESLHKQNIEVIMATGDNKDAAKLVAEQLNIEYRYNQSPQDKHNLVKDLKSKDKTVIMVGDGINDAPSLALADVGIAIGAGTQVAIDSADVILTNSNPGDIKSFIDLSRKTTKKIKENLMWGAGYNFIAIPVAAGILSPIGITLSPAFGAILMSISTVIVAINALALKLKD